jgi:hypothetical protein
MLPPVFRDITVPGLRSIEGSVGNRSETLTGEDASGTVDAGWLPLGGTASIEPIICKLVGCCPSWVSEWVSCVFGQPDFRNRSGSSKALPPDIFVSCIFGRFPLVGNGLPRSCRFVGKPSKGRSEPAPLRDSNASLHWETVKRKGFGEVVIRPFSDTRRRRPSD